MVKCTTGGASLHPGFISNQSCNIRWILISDSVAEIRNKTSWAECTILEKKLKEWNWKFLPHFLFSGFLARPRKAESCNRGGIHLNFLFTEEKRWAGAHSRRTSMFLLRETHSVKGYLCFEPFLIVLHLVLQVCYRKIRNHKWPQALPLLPINRTLHYHEWCYAQHQM